MDFFSSTDTIKRVENTSHTLKKMFATYVTDREFSELQGNLEVQFNELRNKINEEKKYLDKQIETLKKSKQKFWS